MRDVILKTLKLNEAHKASLDSQKTVLTNQDRKLIDALRTSEAFKRLEEGDRDRHLYRQILSRITIEPVSVVERLCNRIPYLIEVGILDTNLNFSKTLQEGMADVDSKDTQAQGVGMYGVGDGADKDEPSGDADKGVSQDGETGDSSKTADSGYLDEDDAIADPEFNQPKGDDDKKGVNEKGRKRKVKEGRRKMKEDLPDEFKAKMGDKDDDDDGQYDESVLRKRLESFGLSKSQINSALKEAEVQKDAPSADSDDERAANDAKYKDGAMQNESEDGQDGPVKDHKPKADDPGEPSAGTSDSKGETPDADTPDYSQVKEEDPSSSELNKGPAQAAFVESFSVIEKKILAMLESAGLKPGTSRWQEMYQKGFSYAIEERGKRIAEAKKSRRVRKEADD